MIRSKSKRCESQSVISINIRPISVLMKFALTWQRCKRGVYSANVRLPQSTFRLRYKWNVGLSVINQSKNMGKNKKKISEKLALETPEPQLQSDCNPYFEYLGKNNVKNFVCSKAFYILKVLYLMKSSDCKRVWYAVFKNGSQFNPLYFG